MIDEPKVQLFLVRHEHDGVSITSFTLLKPKIEELELALSGIALKMQCERLHHTPT
jgi:hypothetical protein